MRTTDLDHSQATEIYRYDCTADTATYQSQSAAIPALFLGTTTNLAFIGHTEALNAGNSNFFVDNISIEDNVAFPGAPGQCFELNPACNTIEDGKSCFWKPVLNRPT